MAIAPADIVDSIARMTPQQRRALRQLLDADDNGGPPPPPVVPSPKKKRAEMSVAERDADDLLAEFGPSQMTIEDVDGKPVYQMAIGDVSVSAGSPDHAAKLLLESLRAARKAR